MKSREGRVELLLLRVGGKGLEEERGRGKKFRVTGGGRRGLTAMPKNCMAVPMRLEIKNLQNDLL